MKRPYQNKTTDDAKMFVGIEVEKTPAHNQTTFFFVGIPCEPVHQELEKYLNIAKINGCTHIYLGANQSFAPKDQLEIDQWQQFGQYFLDQGFLVTLDFDICYLNLVACMKMQSHHGFIPQISIKIPNINLMNYNTTVKIDDVGFEATNPGVWCHLLHNLKNIDTFTDWQKYTKDKII